MADRSLIFPRAEFEARVARLQASMADQGIDALLLTTPADIFYVTGFLTRFWESPARPWFIIVPETGAPIAVIPAIGADLMGQTWINDIRIWDAPDPADDGISLLTETLANKVAPTGAIAVPMGLETHLRMPIGDYLRLVEALAPRRFIDGTRAIQRTREIKSPTEIEKIRAICEIAATAFAQVGDIADIGRPFSAVFRDFQALLLHAGADWVSYLAGAAGPDGYTDVISPATDRPLQPGDVLMLDTGAVKDGYVCDFDRNFFLGRPSDAVRRAQEALWLTTEETLATLRPGMLACDAHRLLSDGLAKRGAIASGGRLGHGLGLNLTEWPSFTPKDTTELRAGMVLTLEPSAIVDGARFLVHEENIVLRDDGPELLSPRAPQTGTELPI